MLKLTYSSGNEYLNFTFIDDEADISVYINYLSNMQLSKQKPVQFTVYQRYEYCRSELERILPLQIYKSLIYDVVEKNIGKNGLDCISCIKSTIKEDEIKQGDATNEDYLMKYFSYFRKSVEKDQDVSKQVLRETVLTVFRLKPTDINDLLKNFKESIKKVTFDNFATDQCEGDSNINVSLFRKGKVTLVNIIDLSQLKEVWLDVINLITKVLELRNPVQESCHPVPKTYSTDTSPLTEERRAITEKNYTTPHTIELPSECSVSPKGGEIELSLSPLSTKDLQPPEQPPDKSSPAKTSVETSVVVRSNNIEQPCVSSLIKQFENGLKTPY